MPRVSQLSPPTSSKRLYAGTSGWAYPTWKPEFYPAGTPAKRFLEFYGSKLTSVEVNYTFRALPTAKMLEGWLAATPADFRFSFKAPQRITHSSFLGVPAFRTTNAPVIAFEFRHESWFAEEIYAILRQHNAALCIAEGDDLLTPEVHTAADCACYRLRRSGGYSPVELDAFAKRFAALAEQRDVYVYFKHEDEPTGALNATAFLERVDAGGR